ncbi:MAG: PKD domain-containing protein [Crocinitomicaceae bacterium]|nr:PKD domain-containing protein [Crocinitomicaceae bacterium]
MKYLVLFILLSTQFLVFTQNSWKQDYSSSKVFIENKGQFDANENKLIGEIQYAADFGSTRVFFGKKGVSYSFLNAKKVPKNEREHLSEKLKLKTTEDYKQWEKVIGKFHFQADEVNMTWENANYSNIKAEGQRSDYHSYSFKTKDGEEANVNYVKGFDKITYKNIYPKIDIEYAIHPQEGLKYAVILHPGANPDDVKMVYDRAVRIENGKVKVATLFGDIVDHEPFTFYQKNSNTIIKSSFEQIGQTIKFKLANYDNKKTVVIDPWTQTPAFPSNWDVIWEVEKDAAGNVYAIGGITPMQLLKYNPTGNLLWTYNTPYDTTGGSWLGGFATSDIGNSYVCNGSATKILCVNTNGGLTWNNNNPSGAGATSEFWTISFNCDQSKLVVGGTKLLGLNPSPWIYDVNMSNGNILASVQVSGTPSGFGVGHEVRALTECNNNKYYYLSHDTIGYINSNLSSCGSLGASNVKIGSGHNFSYKNENFREGNSGIQALKTFGNFVFVHRGDIVEKRNFNTGAIVGTANIPGGSFINTSTFGITTRQVGCSGIDIDDCGNVYVGATNGVVKFNQNLVQQATYPTAFKVYDIHVTTSGNIIAGGSSGTGSDNTRSGGIQHISAAACAPIAITCCDASICPLPNLCQTDAPITVTAATAGGTWSGPGMSANGTFNPATAGTGTHTITYTLPCGSETQTIIVSPCQTLNACIESNGSITVSNGVPTYTWATFQAATNTPITNQAQCTACGGSWTPFINQCLSGVTPITSCNSPAQWVNFATGANATAPNGAAQVQVTDGSGTVTTFTISSLAQCNTTPCPTITVSSSSVNNVSCNGGTNGSATVSASGGTAPYTYSWAPGSLTGATQIALGPNVYTVTATDAAQCTGTTTITITQPTAITLTSSNIVSAACGTANGAATVNATGGTGAYTYSWSPSGGTTATASNILGGSYTVTVQDANQCSQILTVVIPNTGGPTIDNIAVINATCTNPNAGSITVTASGGTGALSYQLGTGTPQTSNVFSNLAAGSYTITVSDANCSNTGTATISAPTSFNLTQGTIVSADCGATNGSATVTATNGSGNYTYNWSPAGGTNATASNIEAGTYNVTVTDQTSGCQETLQFIVPAAGGPTLTLTNSQTLCATSSDGTITASATGGTGPYTFALGTETPQTSATFSNLAAGTYQVTVFDANNCPATQSTTITSPAPVVATTAVDVSICLGQSTTLTASGSGGTGTYTITWGNALVGTTPSVYPTETTTYTMTVTDANNCVAFDDITITVVPVPTALGSPVSLGGSAPLLVNFTNLSTNASNYVWSFGNGLNQTTTTTSNVNTTYTSVGTYTVTLVASNGLCSDSWEGTITVIPLGEIVIEIPNVFSPNNDEVNDVYGIFTINAASQEAAIYNRWGNQIVELNTPNATWDGKVGGKEAVEGVYFMKYKIIGLNGQEKEGQTFLHLIR